MAVIGESYEDLGERREGLTRDLQRAQSLLKRQKVVQRRWRRVIEEGIHLSWYSTMNAEEVVYNIYRGSSPDFSKTDPGVELVAHSITDFDPGTDEIDWIDAAGDYMCVHSTGETYILRMTMKKLEQELDPEILQRVHRSTIVNIHRVREMQSHINGEYFLTLTNGHTLKLSRSYKDKLKFFGG